MGPEEIAYLIAGVVVGIILGAALTIYVLGDQIQDAPPMELERDPAEVDEWLDF